jgi:hypothetical protein
MIEEQELESAFADDLTQYEGKWLALVESEGLQRVVGSGDDAEQAMGEANAKGFGDAYLYKVFPFDQAYVPTTELRVAC